MQLQIVSHCWNYSRLLTYQLSSLVLHPPEKLDVTMTVFYNDEDTRTCEVLEYFADREVPGVTWQWRHQEKGELFRRAIGRNLAALANEVDWLWFTDCDQVFHEGCLDALADLLAQHPDAKLLFPRMVACSSHLEQDDSLFDAVEAGPRIVDIDTQQFSPVEHFKAIGGLQIVPGEVARETGYCKDVARFMRPARRIVRELGDRTFRHALGTHGDPIELPGVYRIEHRQKGRRRLSPAKQL
jgi:hypothetical protein